MSSVARARIIFSNTIERSEREERGGERLKADTAISTLKLSQGLVRNTNARAEIGYREPTFFLRGADIVAELAQNGLDLIGWHEVLHLGRIIFRKVYLNADDAPIYCLPSAFCQDLSFFKSDDAP